MFDVSCVGILVADVLAIPVENLPDKGLLAPVDEILLSVGGCAANAAIGLAKLGASAQIIGKLGADSFGRYVKTEVAQAGVNVDGLTETVSSQTSASVVTVSGDGERTILHCFGANASFCLDDIDFNIIRRSKILFIAGTFLMPAFDGQGARELLKKAREAGILCCLDTAWDPSGRWMDTVSQCLPYLDWFMPSCEEAVQLSGRSMPEDMAAVFAGMGVKNVVIKLGSKGCYVKPQDADGFAVPAYSVTAADTSGAGDAFCAGFIFGLSKNWTIEDCARFANAAGAICVMQAGTTAGIKSMRETLDFMQEKATANFI